VIGVGALRRFFVAMLVAVRRRCKRFDTSDSSAGDNAIPRSTNRIPFDHDMVEFDVETARHLHGAASAVGLCAAR
jgi:hypothetical protein